MKKKILIDANFPTETRVVLLDRNNQIEDVEYDSANKRQIKGNIYLAKITRVEPSLQAAFVDYGGDKSGFLPFSEIHPDYYNIPSIDKKDVTLTWSEITPPEITSLDLAEKRSETDFNQFFDNDEIDISTLEKMVDDKIQSNFDIEADESEIEHFNKIDNNIDPNKSYKIQEVIKKGQILLVQATKEERGNKGASLTSYISLAGKYCVLMPNKGMQNGVSRKISNFDERKRLKDVINSLMSNKNKETSSVIARTAGAGHTTLDIKRDYDYLARLWNKIREATLKSSAPCFIHQEDSIILKTIRDMFDRNVKEIIVQGADAYNNCLKFMRDILPSEINSVKEYKSNTPIFTKFSVEEQLTKLYQPNVSLPSGGYIVINPTEALISIDVNSGKSTGGRNIEEMALKINLEAAKEIARQVRLRDLSGLLVLDFIDLVEMRNRKIVERSLREFLSRDKAKIQTANISSFGLLEMSRQRIRPSFLEINSNICLHCSGKGLVRADEPNSMLILRTIENEIYNGNFDVVNVYGISSSIVYLLNSKREEILFIEGKYSIKLNFYIDRDATSDSYSIEKIKLSEKHKSDAPISLPALQDTSEIYNQSRNNNFKNNKRKINNVTTVAPVPTPQILMIEDVIIENEDKDLIDDKKEPSKTKNEKNNKKKNTNSKPNPPISSPVAISTNNIEEPTINEENNNQIKKKPKRTRRRITKKGNNSNAPLNREENSDKNNKDENNKEENSSFIKGFIDKLVK